MTEISFAALATAFMAGGISFLSPCVLPLVPGYLAFVAGGSSGDDRARPAVSRALLFVCGFSTVFVILGASASLLGQWLLMYKYEATLIGGALTILFGLFTTGLVRLAPFERDVRYHRELGGGPVASYVLGLAFGFGWTPCIGPVLGSILMITAVTASVHGLALLASYSVGLGIPFIIAALGAERFALSARRWGRVGHLLQIFAGTVMIAVGLAIMTGHLTAVALWLLETFPSLARLG